jgi:hypothetical protein
LKTEKEKEKEIKREVTYQTVAQRAVHRIGPTACPTDPIPFQ